METLLHRADYQNGKLTIEFSDAAHLGNAWIWADGENLTTEFERAIMHLIRVALGRCVPRTEFVYEGNTHAAEPGKECKLSISSDYINQPSFIWFEEGGMHGGLIYHSHTKTWGIHT
jgi:hypothetical protein